MAGWRVGMVYAIAAFLVRIALAAQRTPAVTGAEGLSHESGEALTPLQMTAGVAIMAGILLARRAHNVIRRPQPDPKAT